MRIHNVFYVDRFKPYLPSPESLGRRAAPPPDPEIVNGEIERRKIEFLVKWLGYDAAKDSTWVPLKDMTNSPNLLCGYCQ
ncbi:hypothetical protein BGX30_007558, partial [Mortierella sp. GBA39]